MEIFKLRVRGNGTCRSLECPDGLSVRLTFRVGFKALLNLVFLLIVGVFLVSCGATRNTNTNSAEIVISEITTYQTSLSTSDVVNYFCNNLTVYFNSYKYYKISSEVIFEKEKQKTISTATISKQGSIYNVEYIGSSGQYAISFSNNRFPEADEIHTISSLIPIIFHNVLNN